ncbi:MAG: four helix bundle protein, partial [Flammeovirgaceae bacterium]
AQFLNISLGSSYELETPLVLSFDVEFITEAQLNILSIKISEIQKMTHGLIKTLRQESYV